MSRTASSVGVNHVFPGRPVNHARELGMIGLILTNLATASLLHSALLRALGRPRADVPDLAEWQRSE